MEMSTKYIICLDSAIRLSEIQRAGLPAGVNAEQCVIVAGIPH